MRKSGMQTKEEDRPEGRYGMFLTCLFGDIQDAEDAGYSAEGVALLRAARDKFLDEFQARHPEAWTRKD